MHNNIIEIEFSRITNISLHDLKESIAEFSRTIGLSAMFPTGVIPYRAYLSNIDGSDVSEALLRLVREWSMSCANAHFYSISIEKFPQNIAAAYEIVPLFNEVCNLLSDGLEESVDEDDDEAGPVGDLTFISDDASKLLIAIQELGKAIKRHYQQPVSMVPFIERVDG